VMQVDEIRERCAKVKGWHRKGEFYFDASESNAGPPFGCPVCDWHPDEDDAQAAMVRKGLIKNGGGLRFTTGSRLTTCHAWNDAGMMGQNLITGSEKTAPNGAAIKATESLASSTAIAMAQKAEEEATDAKQA